MSHQITGDSAEAVAYALMHAIADQEMKLFGGTLSADRDWILSTYAECLATVRTAEYAQDAQDAEGAPVEVVSPA